MNRFRTALIGAGQIGGGYDGPGDRHVLTHAHAIRKHADFQLSGVMDVDLEKSRAFGEKWQTAAYTSLEQLMRECRPQVVVICNPDEVHQETLCQLEDYKTLKLVICEKPLGLDCEELAEVTSRYESRGIPIAVNYSRNYDSSLHSLKISIERGEFGRLINSSVVYTKGISHNGSHAISLLRYLFGEVQRFRVLNATLDRCASDPTLDAFLEFGNQAGCHLIAGDECEYSIFETSFYFSRALVKFVDFGFSLQVCGVEPDAMYPGYRKLGKVSCSETGLKGALTTLYENVSQHLRNGRSLYCDADDALKTQAVVRDLLIAHQRQGEAGEC